MKPDHYVAGIPIGGFISGRALRIILGRTCGHRHATLAAAKLCLRKKSWKHGKAVAVDENGVGCYDLRKREMDGSSRKPVVARAPRKPTKNLEG